MLTKVKSFGLFWYDFVVGDDWRMAVGVAVAFLITWAVGRSSVPGWWVTPACVAPLLAYSLWRAAATNK